MKEMSSAVILAAGLGTRLKTLTRNKPKALMPVAGEAAIVRVIRQLVSQSIHHIAINIHHHAEQLQQHLGNGEQFNAALYYSYEPELLNSGGGVRTAMDLLPHSDFIAVHNADIMSDIQLQRLLDICPQNGCALGLINNPKHNHHGDFSLEQGLVGVSAEKNYTFSGVSIWSAKALEKYPDHSSFPLTSPIQELISQQQCTGLIHHGQWFDIGRPRDLIQASRVLA